MISVCIATYNGERFIREQISSIINQLGNEDEIIISDNGSTDSTIDIIKEIDDKRIKLIKGPKKKSPTSNFENALMHAKGEYIFLSDQDDVWKDNKISICMQYLKHYDCVISDAEMVDENLNIIEKSYYKVHNTKQSRIYNTLIKNGYMAAAWPLQRGCSRHLYHSERHTYARHLDRQHCRLQIQCKVYPKQTYSVSLSRQKQFIHSISKERKFIIPDADDKMDGDKMSVF